MNDSFLYGLATPNAPFQPGLTQAPSTFAVALTQIAVQFSPTTLNFASAVVDTLSAYQSITLSNPSTTSLSLTGLTLTGSNAADFSLSNGCGATLAPGSNCTVQVAVNTSAAGTRKAYLSVTSNSPASPQYVNLTASDTAGSGIATLSATHYVFADSGVTHDFTLTNTGNGFLTFNSAATLTSFFSATNTCGTGLVAGTSCVISVSNNAPASSGARPGAVTYDYDQINVSTSDTTSSQSIYVTSNEYGRTILPSNIVFPAVAPNATTSTTVSVLLADMSSSCPAGTITGFGFSISSGYQTSSSPPNFSCSYNLGFKAGAAGTTSLGKLSFGAPSGGEYVPLSGTPITPNANFTLTGTNPYTLTNYGTATVNIQSIIASAGFSQTNTCGASLLAQSVCTITTTASDTAFRSGSQGTLTVLDDDGTQAVTLTNSIYPVVNYSTAAVGTQSPFYFGEGSRPMGQHASITAPGGGYTSSGGDFTGSDCYNYYSGCSVGLYFKPQAVGVRTGTFTFMGTSSGTPRAVTVTVVGTGVAAGAALAIPQWGEVAAVYGSSTVFNFYSNGGGSTIYNSGSTALSLSAPVFSGPNASAFSVPSFPCTTIAVGQSCTIMPTFTPAFIGVSVGTISLTDTTSGRVFSQQLVGVGTTPPPTVTPNTMSFPDQHLHTTTSMSYTVTSYQNHPITATLSSSYNNYDSSAFSFTKASCVQGESPCIITIAFTPTSNTYYEGGVFFADTAGVGAYGGSPQFSALVFGTGGLATATLSPSPVTFASRPVNSTSIAQTITLINTGDGTLTVPTPTLTGTNASEFIISNNTCSTTLAAGNCCTLGLSFAPTTSGSKAATLNLGGGTDSITGTAQ